MKNHKLTKAQVERIGWPELAGETVQVEFYKPGERPANLMHVAKNVYHEGVRLAGIMDTKE